VVVGVVDLFVGFNFKDLETEIWEFCDGCA